MYILMLYIRSICMYVYKFLIYTQVVSIDVHIGSCPNEGQR